MVHLRALEPEDLDFLYELENNPALWASTDVLPAPVSRHALREYLRHAGGASLAEAGQLRLIICTEASRQPVGTLDLFDFSATHQRAGVGIAVAKSARRRGYALAALRWLRHYAEQVLGLHQLYCTVAADNAASLRLFRAAGFRRVGLRRQWLRKTQPNGWLDAVEMQLLLA